jgi:plastocyanin
VNLRRTQLMSTAVGTVILAAMEVYVPSVGQTSNATQIEVKDFMFVPTSLTVNAGSTVTWTNKDDEPHTVVSDTKIGLVIAALLALGAIDSRALSAALAGALAAQSEHFGKPHCQDRSRGSAVVECWLGCAGGLTRG